VSKRSTRRGFLSAAGAAGVGAALAPGAAAAASAETAAADNQAVGFHGAHQAGIATPTQQYVQFVSLDLASDAAATDLQGLLQNLSAAASLLSTGRPVGALNTGELAPVDTGEALGLGPARVTVTFGLGPSAFRRVGLAHLRPAPLVDLPAFAGDELQSEISGGDLCIQACADDPQVAFHAAHDLIRLASPTATARWLLAGFGRISNSRKQVTPRNLLGFKDGTDNIMVEDKQELDRFVWAGAPESPAWMRGGSYLVVRRIAIALTAWDQTGLDQQQQSVGRYKVSGAPLGEKREHQPPALRARRHGELVIPASAHIRLASPSANDGQRILRRGYAYVDGLSNGQIDSGLLFLVYNRDPRKQFTPIQRRLANSDALNAFATHIGSAIFAIPPGVRPGGYVGEGLFG
jgi:deferrochelatase/peroxidase EfeB